MLWWRYANDQIDEGRLRSEDAIRKFVHKVSDRTHAAVGGVMDNQITVGSGYSLSLGDGSDHFPYVYPVAFRQVEFKLWVFSGYRASREDAYRYLQIVLDDEGIGLHVVGTV